MRHRSGRGCAWPRTGTHRRRWSSSCWPRWTSEPAEVPAARINQRHCSGFTCAGYTRRLAYEPNEAVMAARFPAVALCGLLALAGCDRQPPAPPAAAAVPVVTTVVQPRQWADSVQALGTARARESVTLTAKVSEIVDQVHFESGQRVAAGQPLVTLRVDAQQAALVEAQAAADEAQQQFQRLHSLAGQQLVAR